MGIRALLTIYDRNTGLYYKYIIRSDGLVNLRLFRVKFQICRSIKGVFKVLYNSMKYNEYFELIEVSDEQYSKEDYWPFIEYSMVVEIIDNSNKTQLNEVWEISPILETMEKSLELAKGQKEKVITKHIFKHLE